MSTEESGAHVAKEAADQESGPRLEVRGPSTQTEPTITEDDNLFDETIRHTVPPPAQENRG